MSKENNKENNLVINNKDKNNKENNDINIDISDNRDLIKKENINININKNILYNDKKNNESELFISKIKQNLSIKR